MPGKTKRQNQPKDEVKALLKTVIKVADEILALITQADALNDKLITSTEDRCVLADLVGVSVDYDVAVFKIKTATDQLEELIKNHKSLSDHDLFVLISSIEALGDDLGAVLNDAVETYSKLQKIATASDDKKLFVAVSALLKLWNDALAVFNGEDQFQKAALLLLQRKKKQKKAPKKSESDSDDDHKKKQQQ